MILVELVSEIMVLAKEIRRLVHLAKSNQEQATSFVFHIEVILSSIQDLNKLPQNQHYRNSLEVLLKHLQDAADFFEKLSIPAAGMWDYTISLSNASKNEKRLTELNETIRGLLPQVVLGFTAQILMDRERERELVEADRQSLYLYFQKEFEKNQFSIQKLRDHMTLITEYLILSPNERPSAVEMRHRLSALNARPSSPTGEDLYKIGVNLEKQCNMESAYQHYVRAHAKGHFKAITRIGLFHLNGEANMPINYELAEKYLNEGAAHQHDLALYHLGRMYQKGYTKEGVNLEAALFFCRQALDKMPHHLHYQAKVKELSGT